MRLSVIASFFVLGACALTTDLDGFTGGAVGVPDGGSDGGAEASVLRDGSTPDARIPEEAGAPTYGDVVMLDHPIAYFPFDEPAGSTLIIEKVSGKNAIGNKPDFQPGAPGVAGTALAVTGHGELEFGDTLDVTGKSPWSIEAWIKPEFEDGKVFYEYLNKRQNGNNGLVTYVRHESGHTTVQVEQSYAGGGRGVDAELKSVDHFVHVVFVYDPGQTGIRVWVDGKVGNAGYDDNGGPTDNTQPVYIASGLKGTIDEMAVYDYALAPARIQAHLAAGKQR